MKKNTAVNVGVAEPDIRALAECRYILRKFLHFSEEAAARVGLAPQQHQLLLQIAGAPEGMVTSVGYLAERLALRHHSVVELCNRCEEAGLIVRKSDPNNRRHVVLKLTTKGNRILTRLSADHERELNDLSPRMIAAFKTFAANAKISRSAHLHGEAK